VRRRVWIPVLLALALAWSLLDGRLGLRAWWRVSGDLAEGRARAAALRAEIADLRAEAGALESSEFAIERAIREELELARSGEVVVRIPLDLRRPRP
jgi:cell division protein FtsB